MVSLGYQEEEGWWKEEERYETKNINLQTQCNQHYLMFEIKRFMMGYGCVFAAAKKAGEASTEAEPMEASSTAQE